MNSIIDWMYAIIQAVAEALAVSVFACAILLCIILYATGTMRF